MDLRKTGLISIAILWMVHSFCFATDIHVPGDQPSIRDAIDVAETGDTVIVADGIYDGYNSHDVKFRGKAITVRSENGPETCIIDGGNVFCSFRFEDSEGPDSVLSGFSITGGNRSAGAGIYGTGASPTIINCIIYGNAAERGGGVFFEKESSPSFKNCIITGNRAAWGAGMYFLRSDPTLTNCIIWSNNAFGSYYGDGAGMYLKESSPIFINCTICQNYAALDGGGLYCNDSSFHMVNSILWENIPNQTTECSGYVSYCDVQGGFPGIGNINADPLFIGGDPFDLHLTPNSPCIDAGTDKFAPSVDFDEQSRPQGGGFDIGAYEYQDWPSVIRTYVQMPDHSFAPGDRVSCSASVWLPPVTSPLQDCPFFVVLEVYGHYYCAPSFSSFDHYKLNLFPGLREIIVIPEFTWPPNAGSASGIIWYAALTDTEMTQIESEIGIFDFEWNE